MFIFMAGLMRGLNKLVVARRVVVRNLSQRRRVRVNYKRQPGKTLDEDTANQNQQEEGVQEAPQHPLDDRDFEAWLDEFYKLYKLSKFRRGVRDAEAHVDPKLPYRIAKGCGCGTCEWRDPSLADGHIRTRVREKRYGTPTSPPFVPPRHVNRQSGQVMTNRKVHIWKPGEIKETTDSSLADGYTHLSKTWRQHRKRGGTRSIPPMAATNRRIRPTRDNKFEAVKSLVAALMFAIGGCLVLSFSSPEVNGPWFAPIVGLFTAGYVVLILYDTTSKNLGMRRRA